MFMVPAMLIKEIDCTVLWSWRKSKAQTKRQKQLYNFFFFFKLTCSIKHVPSNETNGLLHGDTVPGITDGSIMGAHHSTKIFMFKMSDMTSGKPVGWKLNSRF